MADLNTDAASQAAGIDLSQFFQIFFEEAGENLARLEQLLLEIDIAAASDDELNAIFRCAHSVKGGAATFGFADVAELTHEMETLLDKLRRHELAPDTTMVDVLLQAGDALRAQLARHRQAEGDPVDTAALLVTIRALVAGTPGAGKHAAPAPAIPLPVAPPAEPSVARLLDLRVGPLADPADADNLVDLFNEIVDLGTIEPIDGGTPIDGMRRFKVLTTSTDSDLLDLFTFHVSREQVQLLPFGPGYGFHTGNPGVPPTLPTDSGYGFFDNAPGAPTAALAAPTADTTPITTPPPPTARALPKAAAAIESATLRVSVEKVDQLINMVGELVITRPCWHNTARASTRRCTSNWPAAWPS